MDDAKALRARLTALADEHSQAEIARRCGTPRNNVNRYLKGTRVPLDFGAALVKQFGVNPAWLLNGQGVKYLCDVAAGNERLATNLLDLVRSMHAVERMRLGSLSGRHHLKVLRGLNDALKDFESLRARLSKEAAPVFRDFLERFQSALERYRGPEADDLCRALQQVSALCPDPVLELEFTRLRAWHENDHGDKQLALELQRHAFRQVFVAAPGLTPELCTEAAHLSAILRRVDRAKEALQVARAIAALADDPPPDDAAFHWLRCMQAAAELALWRIDLGFPRFMASYSRLPQETRDNAHNNFARFLLVSGTLTPMQVLAMSGAPAGAWQYLLPFIVWQEDQAGLAGALKAMRDEQDRLPSGFLVEAASAMLDALSGGRKWKTFLAGPTMRDEAARGANSSGLRARSIAAQLARIGGDRKRARAEVLQGHALLRGFDPDLTPGLLAHATLLRETLRSVPENEPDNTLAAARSESLMLLNLWRSRGYMFLDPYLQAAA